MFYIGPVKLWKWKMNAARAMGNSLDERYVPDLIEVFTECDDDRVRAMIAWALGRIGGAAARQALERFFPGSSGRLRKEIEGSLNR